MSGQKICFIVLCNLVLLTGFIRAETGAGAETPDALRALRQTSKAFSEVAGKVTPAVVSVRVEQTLKVSSQHGQSSPFGFGSPFDEEFFEHFFGPGVRNETPKERKRAGLGSGFIISNDGFILTNNHVVENADKITVTLKDGRDLPAEIIGTDPKTDVAVIKVNADNLPVIKLGDSNKLEVGEWVIAVGNPFGLSETVTVGVVSAKGRSGFGITGEQGYEDFIQTDAAINPGNSGGPLLNLDGQAIGLNTFIYSQSGGYMGIGFAIPINMAKAIKDQLVKSGKVTRGYIGIGMNPEGITPELAESFGLAENTGILIAQVFDDTPAEKAGLKAGDIILEMNGKKVNSNESFSFAVSLMPPGTEIELVIFRDGKEKKVAVKIGSLADSPFTTDVSEIAKKLGLAVQDLTEELAQRFGFEGSFGVLVSSVEDSSSADEAGMRPGMLILSVNHQPVGSVSEFNTALKPTAKTKKALMLVKTGRSTQYVVLAFD